MMNQFNWINYLIVVINKTSKLIFIHTGFTNFHLNWTQKRFYDWFSEDQSIISNGPRKNQKVEEKIFEKICYDILKWVLKQEKCKKIDKNQSILQYWFFNYRFSETNFYQDQFSRLESIKIYLEIWKNNFTITKILDLKSYQTIIRGATGRKTKKYSFYVDFLLSLIKN